MPKRRKGQGIDFIIGAYRKIANSKEATVAQRLKALDRLAVIDGILDIKLQDPSDQTRPPEPDPEIENQKFTKMVEKALNKARKTVEENNGLPNSVVGRDGEIREGVGQGRPEDSSG